MESRLCAARLHHGAFSSRFSPVISLIRFTSSEFLVALKHTWSRMGTPKQIAAASARHARAILKSRCVSSHSGSNGSTLRFCDFTEMAIRFEPSNLLKSLTLTFSQVSKLAYSGSVNGDSYL
jgi:hypothetical protein